jgi:hypothetical protein
MALDLTLCIVPRQIDAILTKAENNSEYAECVAFIPGIIRGEGFGDFGDPNRIQFKKDVIALREYFKPTDLDYYYDETRCTSTVDYLINEYIETNDIEIEKNILWTGGDKISSLTGGQGIPLRLYNRDQINSVSEFISRIYFEELMAFYDYDKLDKIGVYKVTRSENILNNKNDFERLKNLFRRASENENLIILKVID